MGRPKINRVGEITYNKYGTCMEVIEYQDSNHITIKFEDGYITNNKGYREFQIGEVISPYDKTCCGVGYIGVGIYNPKDYKIFHNYWRSMLQRCYDKKLKEKHPTYKECSMCDEWLCFQTFAKWCEENYYQISNDKMCLDKDILIKENKIYSPNTCVFVNGLINKIFTKRQNDRGEYPIGVSYDKKSGLYTCNCNNRGKAVHLSQYTTPQKAFDVYKNYKEDYLKSIAEEYKNQIPVNLYETLCKYKVEITD